MEGWRDGLEWKLTNVILLVTLWWRFRAAPSVVQDLWAEAEDSVSIRVSWRSPAQPNGLITRYRLQVLADDVLLQDITLTADVVRQMSKCFTQ